MRCLKDKNMAEQKYDAENLTNELSEAGIEFSGCNENGIVWDIDGKTEIQNKKEIKSVLKKIKKVIIKLDEIDEWEFLEES